jgi:hypothetical protein
MLKFLLIGLSFIVAFFAGVAVLMVMAIATNQPIVPWWYGIVAGVIVIVPTQIYIYKVSQAG